MGYGLVVESENPQVLADAIQKIYNMPERDRLRYGQNGRRHALRNFSPKVVVNQYEFLFTKLLESH